MPDFRRRATRSDRHGRRSRRAVAGAAPALPRSEPSTQELFTKQRGEKLPAIARDPARASTGPCPERVRFAADRAHASTPRRRPAAGAPTGTHIAPAFQGRCGRHQLCANATCACTKSAAGGSIVVIAAGPAIHPTLDTVHRGLQGATCSLTLWDKRRAATCHGVLTDPRACRHEILSHKQRHAI